MIFDKLMDLLLLAVQKLMGLLPDIPPVPAWVQEGTSMVSGVLANVGSLGAWVPLPLFGVTVASVGICLVVGLGIKVARIVASFASLGGGSAG